MSFAAAPGQGFFASDVLTLTGTARDPIVLSLTYDPADGIAGDPAAVRWLPDCPPT